MYACIHTHEHLHVHTYIYMLHTCLISCLEFSHLRSCGTLHVADQQLSKQRGIDAAETLVMENASQVLAGQLDVTSWLLMCLCVCVRVGVYVCVHGWA